MLFARGTNLWEITQKGTVVTHGYRGSEMTTSDLETAAAAEAEVIRLIGDKLQAGFYRVELQPERAEDKPVADASKPDLDDALRQNWSRETLAVYADWLEQSGHPRGPLASMQLAGKPWEKHLEKHRRSLLPETFVEWLETCERGGRHDGEWERRKPRLEWDGGWVRGLDPIAAAPAGVGALLPLIKGVLAHPSFKFLRQLRVGPMDGQHDYTKITSAIGASRLPCLEELFLADFDINDSEMSWSELGDLGPIWSAAPNLRHVTIRGGSFNLGHIRLPHLTSLAVRTGGLRQKQMERIASADAPELESLEIWFGDSGYGGDTDADSVGPILEGRFERLKNLGLMNAEHSDAFCAALAMSPIAEQLTRLDLSMGTMGDDGAAVLARARNRFTNLEALDVSDNYLTRAGSDSLRSAFGGVELKTSTDKEIDDDGDEARYVSVGE